MISYYRKCERQVRETSLGSTKATYPRLSLAIVLAFILASKELLGVKGAFGSKFDSMLRSREGARADCAMPLMSKSMALIMTQSMVCRGLS